MNKEQVSFPTLFPSYLVSFFWSLNLRARWFRRYSIRTCLDVLRVNSRLFESLRGLGRVVTRLLAQGGEDSTLALFMCDAFRMLQSRS